MTAMRLRHTKTLLTGKPGVGKTTLIRKIIERVQRVQMAGFYTSEIRSGKYRSGFELRGLNGDRRVLAHVDLKSKHRVGKYGVDTAGFDLFLENLDLLNPRAKLIVIDEIGKMELFSSHFRTLLRQVLVSDKCLLASIALHGERLILDIKQRSDIHLIEVTRNNREDLPLSILA